MQMEKWRVCQRVQYVDGVPTGSLGPYDSDDQFDPWGDWSVEYTNTFSKFTDRKSYNVDIRRTIEGSVIIYDSWTTTSRASDDERETDSAYVHNSKFVFTSASPC